MKKFAKRFLSAFVAVTMLLSLAGCVGKDDSDEKKKENETQASTSQTAEATHEESTSKADLSKALFIGDSRTVGLAEYSSLPADFFCDVGLSARNSLKKTIPVEGVGKVTLEQLLKKKQYTRVYIMLGINEIGGRLESIVKNYSEVVSFVKALQPNASVIIMANLHVTKARSDTDASINNEAINRFNNEVKKLADSKTVFYIDVNPVFDDKDGALKDDMTSDNVHLYAKYYKEWAAWIEAQPLK